MFLRRLGVLPLIAVALVGCHGMAAPAVDEPVALSFRPTQGGAQAWLSTPFAVEVLNERDARALEMMEPTYLGEIHVSHGKLKSSSASMIAAEWGATHFRVIRSEQRVDILLFRVEKDRWPHLPSTLQPPGVAASL